MDRDAALRAPRALPMVSADDGRRRAVMLTTDEGLAPGLDAARARVPTPRAQPFAAPRAATDM